MLRRFQTQLLLHSAPDIDHLALLLLWRRDIGRIDTIDAKKKKDS